MSSSSSEGSSMITVVDGNFVVDGGAMEGGGQILRLATCLSIICNTCTKIINIRGNRRPPGLCSQHLKGLELINKICSGRLKGLKVGSTEVEITSGEIVGGSQFIDCQTAGSITLIMQGVFPCALFAENKISQFSVRGGTNVDWSPSIDYLQQVFLPTARMFGIRSDVLIQKRGFYPEGGGQAIFTIETLKNLNPVDLTNKGHVTSIWGDVFSTSNVHPSVVNDIWNGALEVLKKQFPDMNINFKKEKYPSPKSYSTGIHLFAETSTGCRLGLSELKHQSEEPKKFGHSASSKFIEEILSEHCVDKKLQDQIIVLMALADGTSRVSTGKITSHTSTAIEITTSYTKAKFKISQEGDNNIIECEGIGFKNKYLN